MNLLRSLLFLPLFVFLFGCATTPPVEPDPGILRVGVTPNYPPVIYKAGGELTGVEVEFARKLAAEIGREPVFVEMKWSGLLDALDANRVDIVMSGMSVTRARAFRVSFTHPYMTAGLTVLFRRDDYAAAGMIPSIVRHQNSKVGCVRDTTGAIYARNAYAHAEVSEYAGLVAAVSALESGRVNMVVHDAPAIWWTASHNEDRLVAFGELVNREEMAWAVAKANPELLTEVNAVLERWRDDGSGSEILKRWFPGM